MAGGSKGSRRVLRSFCPIYDPFTTESPDMLARKPQVLLALVLLRVIEHITKTDKDQDWLDFYEALKPLAEGTLRQRDVVKETK